MDLIKHIDESIAKRDSKITEAIKKMEGMSAIRNRHFYNNICSIPDVNYLEIGCWKGSSTCSALYGNKINATVIDNWSEFGQHEKEFRENIASVLDDNKFNFIFSDSFEVDLTNLPKFKIYLYDGYHSAEAHEQALTYYYPVLADEFIFIVDDWSWEHPKIGTYAAIEKLGLKVIHKREMDEDFWNGLGIFLLKK